MDMIDKLRELASRIPRLQEDGIVKTEEGAKNALVMPFINALGYDVFNPLEVTPELTADVGTKKGEKVDYAVLRDNKPIILFECKGFGVNLKTIHASQLYRYFSVTEAKFGVLTNGITYNFYSDLDKPNKMDDNPFLVFDLLDFSETQVAALKQFSKSSFDHDAILTTASTLKYKQGAKEFIASLYNEPNEEFIRMCFKDVYTGRFTQTAIDELTPIAKSAFRAFIEDRFDERLKRARDVGTETIEEVEEITLQEPIPDTKVETTQDEMDAFYTVKSIVRTVIQADRITMRDAQSYCAILIDDNNRRPLCRLYFNRTQKYIGLFDQDKNEERQDIHSIDEIYNFSDVLKNRAMIFAEAT
jgi:hypothetical protein